MPFNLISQCLGQNRALNFIYQSRLDDYIRIYQEDLLALSYHHDDNPLVTESLKAFTDRTLSPLSDLVSNEVFFDLFISFKNNDYRFKGRSELERVISLTYIKYAQFIRVRIASFYNELSKLRTRLRKEKWKIQKIKRVPELTAPIKITLDIRFAIIKRANGKCESCSASIHERPIEVYQLKEGERIGFVAFCENCREKNIANIQEEPEKSDNHGQST
jgi:hypothetical protein